jgi:hypothetical protein
MIPDDDRSTDLYALLFGLHMLLLTEEGEVFTRSELESMARETGYQEVSWLEVPAPYPLMVAVK